MTIRNRISDGTKAAILGVFFLMALVGFFAGSTIQRVVIPGPERVRTVTQTIPGPTVTIPAPTVTATARPTTLPTTLVTVPGPTRTVTRTRTVPLPGPTVTRTLALPGPTVMVTRPGQPVVLCYQVGLLGLVEIHCPK